VPHDLARQWVEALAGLKGVELDHVRDGEDGREGVGELQDADGGDDTRQAGEGGNASGDGERDGPVDGDHGDPGDLAGARLQRGRVEDFDKNVVVDD